jgi:methyl-accepting chemotaxis protein
MADVNRLVEDVLTVRIQQRSFLADGSAGAVERYEEWHKKSNEAIEQTRASTKDFPEVQPKLAELKARLGELDGAFRQIVAARGEKDRVFTQEQSPAARKTLELVEGVAQAATKDKDIALATKAFEVVGDLQSTRAYVLRYLITGTEADFAGAEAEQKQVHRGLEDAIALATAKPSADALRTAQESWTKYWNAANIVHKRANEIEHIKTTRLDVLGPSISKLTGEISTLMTAMGKELEAKAIATLTSAKQLGLGITGGAFVIGTLLSIFTARSITRPINELIARLKDIAEGEGDLTRRVDENRADELGTLGKWFNQFVSRVQSIIRDVADSTRQVAAASTEIAASAEEMAAGLKNQEEQTTQVSAAVEEMAQSVTEVAKKGADAAKAAQEAGNDATQGGSVVESTVSEMRAISEQVTESAKAVADLGKKSEAIGQIIGVINDIADQTNLLALNAAIEAARAGEHGRGFAVVADEVRKLAERTTQATEEVSRSIREIQGETGRAVERINVGTERVGKGVELASSAGLALKRIVSGSQSVQSMVHSIAAAAEEQSAASEQIARSVESISAVTRESNQAASQSAQAAAELSTHAEKLNALIGKFKV